MTATRLHDIQEWRFSLRLQSAQRCIEDVLVGHAPFAEFIFEREVLITGDAVKTAGHQERAHTREVCIAAVKVSQIIALVAKLARPHRERINLFRIFHDAGRRLRRISPENGGQATVRAKTVRIKIGKEYALVRQAIHIDRHVRKSAEARHNLAAETLQYDNDNIGALRCEQAFYVRFSPHGGHILQIRKQTIGFGRLHKTIHAGNLHFADDGTQQTEHGVNGRVVELLVLTEIDTAQIHCRRSDAAANRQEEGRRTQ